MTTTSKVLLGGALAGTLAEAFRKKKDTSTNKISEVAETAAEVASSLPAKNITKATTQATTKAAIKNPGFLSKLWTGTKNIAKKAKVALIRKTLGTKLGQKLAKVSLKTIGKLSGKAVGKSLLKKVPILGLLAGIGLAIPRVIKKDWLGAAGELISGIASCFPGLGTAASAMIDAGLLAKDLTTEDESDTEKVEVDDDGKLKSTSIIDSNDEPKVPVANLPTEVTANYSKLSNQGSLRLANDSTTVMKPIKLTSELNAPARVVSPIKPTTSLNDANKPLTKVDLDKLEARVKKSTDQIFQLQRLILGNQLVDNTKGFKINGKDNQLNG